MTVFETISGEAYPTEDMRGNIFIKKVAKKDISRENKEETCREFVPVFMDDTNR